MAGFGYRRDFSDARYFLDVFRKRVNYPELKKAVMELAKKWKISATMVEDKASGTQLIQELKQHTDLPIRAYMPNAGSDKAMRLYNQTDYFEKGRVLLPKAALWLSTYVGEITGFPNTTFKDQVDSKSQFFEWWSSVSSQWESRYRNIRPVVLYRSESFLGEVPRKEPTGLYQQRRSPPELSGFPACR